MEVQQVITLYVGEAMLVSMTVPDFFLFCTCYPKVGVQLLTAQKANKEVRLVKRKVCYILDAGNWCTRGRGGKTTVQKPTASHNQWGTDFIVRERGLHAKTAQSALTVILNWSSVVCLVSSWLF